MSPRRLRARREPVDAWASFLAITAAFVGATAAAHWNPKAFIGFTVLCAVVSFRPRLFAFALVALLGPLSGSFTWPQAGTAAALLLLGPLIITAAVAAAEFWIENDIPTARIAAARVV